MSINSIRLDFLGNVGIGRNREIPISVENFWTMATSAKRAVCSATMFLYQRFSTHHIFRANLDAVLVPRVWSEQPFDV